MLMRKVLEELYNEGDILDDSAKLNTPVRMWELCWNGKLTLHRAKILMVLLYTAKHHSERWCLCASNPRIQELTGMGRRATDEGVKWLEDHSWIKRKIRREVGTSQRIIKFNMKRIYK